MTLHFAGLPPCVAARLAADRDVLRALRASIEDRIEADIALLDSLDGNTDQEDGGDDEPSLGAIEATLAYKWSGVGDAYRDNGGLDQSRWGRTDLHDREDGDDNGIADEGGLHEQHGVVHFLTLDDFRLAPSRRFRECRA